MMTDPSPTCSPASATPTSRCTTRCACPSSKLKEALAAILQREGYIDGFTVADDPNRPGGSLTITDEVLARAARTISGLRRVSKPGLRIYTKADKVPRVLGGLGVAVLSTSKGLMTDREAREAGVGGEILCFVW